MSDNIFSKYNARTYERIDWNVDTEGFAYFKLGDAYRAGKKSVHCNGLFLTKGAYGLQAVAIGDKCFYNLPSYKVEIVKKMLADVECVNAIKAKRLSLKIREYVNRTNKTCYDCDFIDSGNKNGGNVDEIPF